MFTVSHIAIAVRNVEESSAQFARLFGIEPKEFVVRIAPSEGVRLAEKVVGGVEFEFMEPLGDSSPISSFLEKRGEGIHHICFEVDEIGKVFENLKARGVRLLSDEVKSLEDYYYFFVHPKSAGGILIEFKEKRKETKEIKDGSETDK